MNRAALVLLGAVALAAAAPHPEPSPSKAPVYLDVRLGVRIEVKLDQQVSTQDNRTGQRFTFETTREFDVGDVVVPRGTRGWGLIEFAEPRAGKDHGGRLSLSVSELDLAGGRAIPVALPTPDSEPHTGSPEHLGGLDVPVFGHVVTLDADSSGNVTLHKGETFAVITTSTTATPQPIPHAENT